MAKITIIGAGSTSFGKQFMSDLLGRPALAGSTLALMDINQQNLDTMSALAAKMAKQVGSPIKIESTTDRRRAIDGADYIISIVLHNGPEVRINEYKIAMKYGVDQAVGCTTGPGGVMRSLRDIPLMLDMCKDIQELSPDGLFLHYANPTSIVPWALNVASPVKSIGMCHSVQGTAIEMAAHIGAPYEETSHWAAGVNHQAWFLKFEWNGRDAYPLLFEKMEDPEIYKKDMVRFELMRYFGYFVSESSYHNSEYVPYFRKNQETIARYAPKIGIHKDARDRWIPDAARRRRELELEACSQEPVKFLEGHEYTMDIINAIETNKPYRFNGNVMNTGLITNLPNNMCVEVPCLVDGLGVHPCYVGQLPLQCASLNMHRSAGDALAVKAALEGDPVAAEMAIALDPLTGAVCTLDQIRAMTKELLIADAPYLPQFKK